MDMRKFKWLLLAAITTCCGLVTLSSCSDDDDPAPAPEQPTPPAEEPTPAGAPTYTIMMYGCGGASLDPCMQFNLDQIEGYGYTDRVKFAALVKYSIPWQKKEGKEGTRYMTMTAAGMSNEKRYESNFMLNDPQNLANFIVETQQKFPADKYILVFWNHGSTFDINDQPVKESYVPKKSLLVDDNNDDTLLSIFEMEEAMKRAEKAGAQKISVVYLDVCLMNMIENIYQIKDHTDYVMGAGHLTPGLGGSYPDLIASLEEQPDLESALKVYVPKTAYEWEVLEGMDERDLVVTRMDKIEPVIQAMKNFSDCLCAMDKIGETDPDNETYCSLHLYGGSKELDNGADANKGVLYFFDKEEYSIDLSSMVSRLSGKMLNGTLSSAAGAVRNAMNNAIVVESSSSTELSKFSVGITWMTKDKFQAPSEQSGDFQIKTLSELYKLTAFDKATGWSKFLDNWEYKNIRERLAKDEAGDIDQIPYNAYDYPEYDLTVEDSDFSNCSDVSEEAINKDIEELLQKHKGVYLSDEMADTYYNDILLENKKEDGLVFDLYDEIIQPIFSRVSSESSKLPEFSLSLLFTNGTKEYVIKIDKASFLKDYWHFKPEDITGGEDTGDDEEDEEGE